MATTVYRVVHFEVYSFEVYGTRKKLHFILKQ